MDIRILHNEAMDLADRADLCKLRKETDESLRLYELAFEKERKIAIYARENRIGKPTESVLIRSAASLAYNAKLYREAEKMIAYALWEEPPFEIAEELRDLLEMVNFERHMQVKGVELQEGEIQLVISGKGVSNGIAKSEEVLNRINNFVKLTERTIERTAGKPFRKNGQISKELKPYCNSFLSALRPASLAFTIKFSKDKDTPIPGFNSLEHVIEDITTNIALIDDDNMEALKANIPDESYRSNFIALTKELAPDGEEVSLFGITSINNGVQKRTSLQKSRKSMIESIKKNIENDEPQSTRRNSELIEIKGMLTAADAIGQKVKIYTEDKTIQLFVPDGLSDIVKSYWESEVTVRYRTKSGKKYLETIDGI